MFEKFHCFHSRHLGTELSDFIIMVISVPPDDVIRFILIKQFNFQHAHVSLIASQNVSQTVIFIFKNMLDSSDFTLINPILLTYFVSNFRRVTTTSFLRMFQPYLYAHTKVSSLIVIYIRRFKQNRSLFKTYLLVTTLFVIFSTKIVSTKSYSMKYVRWVMFVDKTKYRSIGRKKK